MTKPKAISLFCGAGGCSLGFQKAGYKIIYASDFNKAAIETYKLNFPDTSSEVKDIVEQDFKQILKKHNLKKGELDILIGGPPCQGFSTAGTRFWDDPRNQLLKEYVRCLETVRPKWFLMENVEGLLTSNKGQYVFEAAKAFIDLGYSIRIDKIYSQEYGVPQRRKRVLIIGNRFGKNFSMPEAISKATGRIFKNSKYTLGDALINLPKPSSQENSVQEYNQVLDSDLFNYYRNPENCLTGHYSKSIEGINLERIKGLKQGQSMKDLPEDLQHESFKKRSKRRVKDGTPSEKRGGPPSGLKRLYMDQPSLTITSAATREFIHPIEDRPLTLRESARIQTFPDYFQFRGNQSEKIKQVGNAIPPMLAMIFAQHIKKYGFSQRTIEEGKLISFNLTKAKAMSPALLRTKNLLMTLRKEQLSIF
jgi:DNA (cytosine-5)-methyltransferase 1